MGTMYQLLALDLDGTLLDRSSRVTKQNARAVRRAQMAGVKIALCTGRHLADARLFGEQLFAPADWAVTVNGALVSRLGPAGLPNHIGGVQPLCFRPLLLYSGTAVFWRRVQPLF